METPGFIFVRSEKRNFERNFDHIFQVVIPVETVGRFPSLNVFSGPMGQGLSSDTPFRPDGFLNKKIDITCIYIGELDFQHYLCFRHSLKLSFTVILLKLLYQVLTDEKKKNQISVANQKAVVNIF